MQVKHLDQLYTWKQIGKVVRVGQSNRHNGVVPVAVCAPDRAFESCFVEGMKTAWGWKGTVTAYYAKLLWDRACVELAGRSHWLDYDVVPVSECFNTIRFRDHSRAREYVKLFWEKLERLADSGEVRTGIGRLDLPKTPWGEGVPYAVRVIPENADPEADHKLGAFCPTAAPGWEQVKDLFVGLTEDELALLQGADVVNRTPTALDEDFLEACRSLNTEEARALLARGAAVNAIGRGAGCDTGYLCAIEGFTNCAHEEGAWERAKATFEMLAEAGADPNLIPFTNGSPLFEATNVDGRIVSWLLDRGADPNAVGWIDVHSTTPPYSVLENALMNVAADGPFENWNGDVVDMLVKHGAKDFSEIAPDYGKE